MSSTLADSFALPITGREGKERVEGGEWPDQTVGQFEETEGLFRILLGRGEL